MEIKNFGAGVFVIHHFLSKDECDSYIASSEKLGYSEAVISTDEGEQIFKDARNNDRILYDNPALAQELYERARPLLPAVIDDWQLSGFNERFRFYRYKDQQFFKQHKDGTFRRSDTEESFLTFIMYLNDDFDGGHTDFVWESIQPKTGSVLVFPHRLNHQGSAVTSGTKYVLRTDVMYRQVSGLSSELSS